MVLHSVSDRISCVINPAYLISHICTLITVKWVWMSDFLQFWHRKGVEGESFQSHSTIRQPVVMKCRTVNSFWQLLFMESRCVQICDHYRLICYPIPSLFHNCYQWKPQRPNGWSWRYMMWEIIEKDSISHYILFIIMIKDPSQIFRAWI